MTNPPVISAKTLPEMVDFLQRRRSSKIKAIGEPGPSQAQLGELLTIAARVPDHGKLTPWRFIIFQGSGRLQAGQYLQQAWLSEEPEATPAKLDLEAERFLRAPVVIAVVSSLKEGKAPEWEQILSAGAACLNLCLATNAMGFATTWVTEWYAYNPVFQKALGLGERERFAGFIYIGTAQSDPEERDRPDITAITEYFSPVPRPPLGHPDDKGKE